MRVYFTVQYCLIIKTTIADQRITLCLKCIFSFFDLAFCSLEI